MRALAQYFRTLVYSSKDTLYILYAQTNYLKYKRFPVNQNKNENICKPVFDTQVNLLKLNKVILII